MIRGILLFLPVLVLASIGTNCGTDSASKKSDAPYWNAELPVEQRADDLLSRMTPEEKASMLIGSGWMESQPVPRLEIPAIKMADGPMWAVMSACNKVNGLYCAENPYLLKDTLQKRWGFQWFVISDWGGTYSTAGSVNAGLHLEMPGGEAMRNWLARPQTQEAGNGAGWLTQDKVMDDWVAEPGAFQVLIGASSRDIRLRGSFELTQ